MKGDAPGERWYRRLLRLYPRDFRDQFGREMTRLYRDRRRGETALTLWRQLAVDLVRTVPAQHVELVACDVRDAFRALGRTPMMTAAAVLTLALGVGANTAVYSVVRAIVLRPLPYQEPGRLVEVFEEHRKTGAALFRASALNYLTWAERARSFDALGAFGSASLTLTGNGDPELLIGSVVTASYFRVLGIRPLIGRGLDADDEHIGAPRVALLSEPMWRARFGGDRHIVGASIVLDGEPHRVIGIMPRAFREVGRSRAAGAADAQLFVPMRIDRAAENRGNHTLRVVGRLRRDVPQAQAGEELQVLAAAMAKKFPDTNLDWSVRVDSLSATMVDPQVRRSLLLLLGAVMMVFLIACANLANLQLVRGLRRQGELAVRTALGAGRSRLVRQLLTESVCLAIVSGVAGIAVAAIVQPLIPAFVPSTILQLEELRLDSSVLAFGALVTLVSGLVCGVVPAIRASRRALLPSLSSVGRATADSARVRVKQTLIAAQIALATVLLVGAALLLQGFDRLQRAPLGFEPDGVLTARLTLPRNAYPDAARVGEFYDRVLATLKSSAPRDAVAVAGSAPFAPGVRAGFRLAERGQASSAAAAHEIAAEHIVSGDYFRVLAIPLVAGRAFTDQDSAGSTPVAVVSQSLARVLWPDVSPLGRVLERGGRSYEVVGVVGDVRGADTQGARGGGADRAPRAAVYFDACQMPQRSMTVLVRASELAPAIAAVREAVRRADGSLPLQQVRPLPEWVDESLSQTRLTTALITIFAVSALLLTAVGIYGVLGYTVASRTKEIGIRVAMGATHGRVIGLVLREGLVWAGGGIAAGLIAAAATAHLIATLLYEVPARDPVTFAAVGGAVCLVAVLACAIPAARALAIDPTLAIRSE